MSLLSDFSAPSVSPVICTPKRFPFLRWIYPVILAALIVIASGRSQVAGPDIVNFDKLVHFAVFGLLATLVVRSPGMGRVWPAALAVSFFGLADELRQSFTPGRLMEFADWVADTAGAIVAVTIYSFWPWYRRLIERPLFSRPARVPEPASDVESVVLSSP